MTRRLIVEPRVKPAWPVSFGVVVVSAIGAALVGGVFLAVTGHSPLAVYSRMVFSGFGSTRNLTETLVSATPLILTGVAAALAFRMLIWNIGAEGQLYLGALFGAGTALILGDGAPSAASIPLVLVAGAVGGAVWAALAAVPRALLGTNEIITTLMLNFVALHLMNYLIFGSASAFRDPTSTNFPQGRPIPEIAELPLVWGRLHAGILVAVAVAALVWWALRSTRWGFEVRVVGDSEAAARNAGIDIRRKVLVVLCLSGAVAGLAGSVHLAGLVHALEPRALAVNLGFTGIIVAALARLNPLGVVPVAVLIGALNNAGSSLQTARVPISIVLMIQGAILLFAVAGEYLLEHRIRWVPAERVAEERAEAPVGVS